MDHFTRDGLRFDVRDHPPADPGHDAPVAVLLHGFPQDASAYDAVVPLLTRAGVRVLVPDQRGYSPGARPPGRRPYAVPELVADVVALLDAAGVDEAHVVGHDWGGAVAWAVAARVPDRTASLTALGTPHPAAMRAGLLRGSQAVRSSYVGFFQLPGVPERLLLADGGARLRRSLTTAGLEPDRAERYVARMREPGALTAALAWYRALPVPSGGGTARVEVPTTYVAARRDPFFAPASVAATARHVDGPYLRVDLDADHWLPEHRPADVAAAVLGNVR
ncbi:alpha/beta fold hydrolase [Cellulomonas shaoxiangyii]|uniref:Alpha/beta fold hydrolase n=1 Tax=Cellulomonas shaoxiangyii TaxID=2566013 RepID=A0A4P7SF80_9CELL|nr:alpha/beta fold hydrolase [Cellulomonas shaoxiangyii]QCB92642.1 alpha/beta fold hydrolase [Cellulomonas shaoxiangyii]TGY85450.1 alpha/beta fold hydrolase [Cellulomonas shaoxiangyii]